MLWALAVLFFQPPAISPDLTAQAERAPAAISTAAPGPAAETESTARPEAKPNTPAAATGASSASSPRDVGSAEEKPVPVRPSGTAPPAGSTAASNAANVSTSASSSATGLAPLSAGKTLPLLYAGRARTPKLWYALVAAGHGAATFDAWSTRRAIQSGRGRELDPFLRPFANTSALYGAVQVGPAMLDYLARRMMKSQKRWVRRLWWLPQVAGTAGFMWSGAHNLRVANR